jgi:3,4-dihydroxy 2-butanone 4-phosphate synthase / GTP cyclohydrolase II
MAATLVDQKSVAFMIRNGSGIISVGMEEEDLTRLMIPMMSPITEIEDITAAASTVTVVCYVISYIALANSQMHQT